MLTEPATKGATAPALRRPAPKRRPDLLPYAFVSPIALLLLVISFYPALYAISGGPPDVGGVVRSNAQEYCDIGMLESIGPYFTAWDKRADYVPSVVEAIRGQPGQPILYLPVAILPHVLCYRAAAFLRGEA